MLNMLLAVAVWAAFYISKADAHVIHRNDFKGATPPIKGERFLVVESLQVDFELVLRRPIETALLIGRQASAGGLRRYRIHVEARSEEALRP